MRLEAIRQSQQYYDPRFSHLITPNYSQQALISQNLHKHSIDQSLQNICDFQESAVKLAGLVADMVTSPPQLDRITPIHANMLAAKNKQCKVVMTDLIADGIVRGLVMHSGIAHRIATTDSHTAFEIEGHEGTMTFGDRMKQLIAAAIEALFEGSDFNYEAGKRLHDLLAGRYATTIPISAELYVVASRLHADAEYSPEGWNAAIDELVTN